MPGSLKTDSGHFISRRWIMSANQKMTAFSQGIHEQSSTQKEKLGTLRVLADGRKFRYAKAGGTALAIGIPTQSAAAEANHINKQCAAAAIGSTVVFVTVGATAVTEDQYKDGWLMVNDGTGQYCMYPVLGNSACAGSGTTTVVLAEPIRVALVGSGTSEVSLIPNAFYGVVVGAANGHFAGVPPIDVTANYYYWSQTGGMCCALNTNAVAVGSEVALGAGKFVLATAYTTEVCGTVVATAGVTDEGKPIWLKKD